MGQFMGWQSYDLKTRCEICGEVGPREDMDDHELYCQGPSDEEEFVKQSEETIEEMKRESCYLSDEEKKDEDGT